MLPLAWCFLLPCMSLGVGDWRLLPGIKLQLYADNLSSVLKAPGPFFGPAGFTAQYVRSVDQDVSPGKVFSS